MFRAVLWCACTVAKGIACWLGSVDSEQYGGAADGRRVLPVEAMASVVESQQSAFNAIEPQPHVSYLYSVHDV